MIGTPFVRGSNPVWYFVDLVGNQTDGSFYLWTLTNTIPYIPQAVYHDVNGLIPWTDPIQFLANGTLPIDIFFDSSLVYRLEIRQNDGTAPPSQADALIYIIENYVPNGTGGGSIILGSDIITQNQITNPQFSVINFQSPLVLTGVTNPDPIEIAPDWFLELTGTGSITVTQIPLNTAFSNPTNAPYALSFNSMGWANPPVLRQRFAENGMNWQNKTVATSVTARIDGASQNLQVNMFASNGQPLGQLINAPLTNAFTEFQGNLLVPTFANLNLPPDAYIDYQIILPQTGVSYITSVQVTESQAATNVEYLQDTINRQLDHTFHYYNPKLQYKPIPSYLTGWDFPLNPAQFLGDAVAVQPVGANKSYYAWDQTIIFQTADNGISVARSLTDGISMTPQQIGSFAMIQYLGRAQAKELLSSSMSVYLEGSSVADIEGTITIWATDDAMLPDIKTPNFNSLVSAVSATGVVTAANGTWTKVTRGSLPDVRFTLDGDLQSFSFNGWELPGDPLILTAEYLAIVIAFETAAVGNSVEIDKIALCAGDIATRPAPQTPDQVIAECNRFYWKTFQPATIPATNAGLGSFPLTWQMLVPAGDNWLTVPYPVVMRANPVNILYNPAAANNAIRDVTGGGDCTTSSITSSQKMAFISGIRVAGALGNVLVVHATADARFGVVL